MARAGDAAEVRQSSRLERTGELNCPMRTRKQPAGRNAHRHSGADRYLSVLLSQTLVAFTLEFDNEFERRMLQSGYSGALSLVAWSNLMQFLAAGDLHVRELAKQALTVEDRLKFELGCLERWGFVLLQPDPADDRPVAKRVHRLKGRMLRDGWGSGRGIRAQWLVRLTEKGRKATEIWAPLFEYIEERWANRFGQRELNNLRQALRAVVEQLGLELPQALPGYGNTEFSYSPLQSPRPASNFLPTLLSQSLLAFTMEFDRESPVPLALCANTLRVLGEVPIPLAEIPRLTGGSPETTDIGWQMKPYVSVERDPAARRGKAARLTPLGLKAQQTYHKLAREIDQRWQTHFGKHEIRSLRECLERLFASRNAEGGPLIAEGLIPAEGTVRSGAQAPALGRRVVGPAARQRVRDLVAQTEMFLRDPENTLPHYPLWDMNRGFGP